MKRVLLTLALAMMFSLALDAQTKVVKDSTGNYVTVTSVKKKSTSTKTGKFLTIKDVKYPIYKGSKGGLYVIRTSKKSGKEYKQYLKIEGKK